MHRTERILIRPSDTNYRAVAFLCRQAKTIFNCANYLARQSFFDGDLLPWNKIDINIRNGAFRNPAYSMIPNAMSQAIIRKMGIDWKSYFASLRQWKKQPGLFKSKPRPPGYAKKSKTALMPFQSLSCINGHIVLPKKTGITPIRIKCCENQPIQAKGDQQTILEVRFVPHGSCFWLEVVYRMDSRTLNSKTAVLLDKKKHLSIDIGINNLATIVSDQPGFAPVLINGKAVKSINHLFNKDAAILRRKGHGALLSAKSVKRSCWINDHFHKASRFVIQLCLDNDIGTLVIGHNPGWKQSVNIGKVNNQKFVSIPHAKLINQISYKAAEYGIDVIVREESYTSQASALDGDQVPQYDAGNNIKYRFSGRRVKRGLYKTQMGLLLNADVNGALNILRKEIGDSFLKSVADEGLVFRPRRVTLT